MFKLGFKSTFKSAFNFKSWIGWDSLSKNSSWIRNMYYALLRQPTHSHVKDTYEEAIEKYGYSPEFLEEQKRRFQLASRLYLTLLVAGIIYMVWLFFKKRWMAFVVMGPINFLVFSFFFRESFWYMQLRHQKLGMTMQDWFQYTVLRNG